MSGLEPWDVTAYAITLSKGGALNVRRVAQYADYDEGLLSSAVNRVDYDTQGLPENQRKGIRNAVTMALGDAQDRAYQRRNRR